MIEYINIFYWKIDMILSDRDIRMFISCGAIAIEPSTSECAYSSTSLDLRLDHDLLCFRSHPDGLQDALDPSSRDYVLETVIRQMTVAKRIGTEGFDLQPQAMVLGWTMERIGLDVMSRIAARVEGKSSLARIGLAIHITAPTIHAGFRGTIQLEIVNHGPLPIRLRKGMKICQLIFEQAMSVPQTGYNGQFQDQGRLPDPCRAMPPSIRHAEPDAKAPCRRARGLHVPRAVPGGA